MHSATFRAGVGLAALLCACGSTTTVTPAPVLPLRTLRLYETGVGYFERSGEIALSRGMSLPVPAGHLDDALKTLVVLGAGGKTSVQGVEFTSSVSHGMARALAGLPVTGDEKLDLEQLLVGLKGAVVEVRTRGATHEGRLVEVVAVGEDGISSATTKDAPSAPASSAKSDPARAEPLTLILLTSAGAIVRIPVPLVDSVRPVDRAWAARLGSALDALSVRGAQSERLLRIMSEGSGPVSLGYVAETPVWRTTYRLVRDSAGGKSVLQGWALLHNDTDEDWRGVRVELANGRPDSFLVPLAAPRYARRELVAPDDHLATVPQLMGNTVDTLWGDQVGDANGSGGLGLSGVGEGGGGRGEGIGLGSIGTLGHGSGSGGSSSLLEVGNLAATAAATGVEAGALFVYALRDTVNLRAHGSALVPFTQQPVDASPIAWFESAGSGARSGVRFVNSTSQTLPAGTIAFFGDGGFAGEASLARLKPGERCVLTYGLDLDVTLDTRSDQTVETTKRLVWKKAGEMLEEHYLRTRDVTYALENRSQSAREVVLVTALGRNATLTGADKVEVDEATSHPLALFSIEARKAQERAVHTVEGLERGTRFAALTSARLHEMAASPSLEAADRGAISEAEARLHEAEEDANGAAQAKAEMAEVQKDLDRLREEAHALAGEHAAAAPANPFVARLLAAEDKLTALRKQEKGFEAAQEGKAKAAKVALAKLTR